MGKKHEQTDHGNTQLAGPYIGYTLSQITKCHLCLSEFSSIEVLIMFRLHKVDKSIN